MSFTVCFQYCDYVNKIKNGGMMSRKKLLCISLIYVLSSFAHGKVLTFSINDWCPYICDPSAKKPGILIEIVQEIFQTEGYQVRFNKTSFKRAIEEIQNNRVQGIVGIVPEVLPDLIFPEEPVIKTQFCFFTLPQQKWEYNSFKESYPDTRVAVVAGKKVSFNIARVFPKIETIHGDQNTSKRLIEMLKLHRIDTFIEEKTAILYLLKQNRLVSHLRIAGCAEKKNEYVAFSPADPHSKKYAELFSNGIKRLKKSGRIKEIIASYID